MMRRFFILSTLLCFFFCSYAQSNFHKLYDNNLNSDGGRGITQTLDGGFIAFGISRGGGAYLSSFLKIDSNGVTNFNKGYEIQFDDQNDGGIWNNSYYGVGSHYNSIEGAADSHIMLIKPNGDSLKAIIINFEFNDRIHDALVKPDSTFIVYGFYTDTLITDNFPFVANVDSLGNVLWFQTYNDSNLNEVVTNIEATQDGGYVFAGKERPRTSSGAYDLFITKIDSLGNLLWKQTYPEPLNQAFGYVTTCQDGGFAIVGTGYGVQKARQSIIRTDSAGNLLWQRKFGNPLYDEGFQFVKELPNGNFICAGNNIRLFNGMQIPDVNLKLLDNAGNLLWDKSYNYYDTIVHQYVNDLIVTSDGGFAMTGFITNTPFPQRNDVFILKVDGNGIITGVENSFQMVDHTVKVYPNPTTGTINISTDKKIENIAVYDMQGRISTTLNMTAYEVSTNNKTIVTLSGVETSTSNKTIVTLSGVETQTIELPEPKGMYLLQFQFKDGTVRSEKVIKN